MSTEIDDIERLIHKHMRQRDATPFEYGKTRLPLSVPGYGAPEVIEALKSLLSTYVTMGEKVKQFEGMFAEYVGVRHAVMVNSGSSANLLALSSMKLSPGSEVITPAITWATTVYPISQVGCIPVLVDVGQDYNIDPKAIERAITGKTAAILPVHLMGNPCDMDAIMDIRQRNGIHAGLDVLEDACEAHGAEWNGQKVGSFGDMSIFSFFFSHHISTIEGGVVVSNYGIEADLCRSMRAFGWTREMENREEAIAPYPEFDPRFLFLQPGFNLRPTEIQGAFGIHQLPRLEDVIAARRETAAYFNKNLAQFEDLILPEEREGTRHVWFGYPITIKESAPFTREELMNFLESKGLETRPIGTGNMANQPVMKYINHRVEDLPMAEMIDKQSFFFGCHEHVSEDQREGIVGYFKEFYALHYGRKVFDGVGSSKKV